MSRSPGLFSASAEGRLAAVDCLGLGCRVVVLGPAPASWLVELGALLPQVVLNHIDIEKHIALYFWGVLLPQISRTGLMLAMQAVKHASGEFHTNSMSWACIVAQRCQWLAEVTRPTEDLGRLWSVVRSITEVIWCPGHQRLSRDGS